MIIRASIFIAIITIATLPFIKSGITCAATTHCEYVGTTVYLSKDPEKREMARVARDNAFRQFGQMFEHRPSNGVLILDSDLEQPLMVKWWSDWVLRFDPENAESLDAAVAKKVSALEKGLESPDSNDPDRTITSHIVGPLSKDRAGVLAHELCHVLIAEIASNPGLSDALEEIAAVTCEPIMFSKARIQRARELSEINGLFDWNDFLSMQHPVTQREQLAEALLREIQKSGKSVKFSVNLSTDLGREIDVFYSQAAVFSKFWQLHCPEDKVFSSLYDYTAKGGILSNWLIERPSNCGPKNLSDFEVAVSTMMESF